MTGQTAAEKHGDIIQGRGGNIAGQLPRLLDDSRASARIRRVFFVALSPASFALLYSTFTSFSPSLSIYPSSSHPLTPFSLPLSLSPASSFYLISSAPISHATYIEHFLFAPPSTLHAGSHPTSNPARKLLCEQTMRNERSNVP